MFSMAGSVDDVNKVGVLLGTSDSESIQVATSFEIVAKYQDNQVIVDKQFYDSRLQQFKVVMPHLEKVGVYQIAPGPSSTTKQLAEQLGSDLVIIINHHLMDNKEFVKSFYKSQLVNSTIVSDEIENISINTITKHQQYTQTHKLDLNGVNLQEYKQTLMTSVNQLADEVQSILEYCDSNHRENVAKSIEINNLIGQLVKKINYLKSHNDKIADIDSINEKLISNELTLMTTQLLSIDKLKHQINSNITKIALHNNSGFGS